MVTQQSVSANEVAEMEIIGEWQFIAKSVRSFKYSELNMELIVVMILYDHGQMVKSHVKCHKS